MKGSVGLHGIAARDVTWSSYALVWSVTSEEFDSSSRLTTFYVALLCYFTSVSFTTFRSRFSAEVSIPHPAAVETKKHSNIERFCIAIAILYYIDVSKQYKSNVYSTEVVICSKSQWVASFNSKNRIIELVLSRPIVQDVSSPCLVMSLWTHWLIEVAWTSVGILSIFSTIVALACFIPIHAVRLSVNVEVPFLNVNDMSTLPNHLSIITIYSTIPYIISGDLTFIP